ncbi:Zinc finger, RING-type [Corchorus capsularis]|uniref:Zinc finger, RING-type n=1 Tax=Corchorus capsularis TaxID=210143 RepID=A0A1R3HGW5_COCAP|nr:Zinc finger, RING-type [Corchorus capsularis]
MAEEEEVKIEVEAVQSVYGEDCQVIESYPPCIHLHIKPRTADVSSQQFVEAVIGIRATSKYPEEPPLIYLIDSKGLDEQRQTHLISSIRDRACELPSCFMLVAICEEAVEKLSSMNHPDGDCPLCLFPLMSEDDQTETLPFMKLMSCFHCFHSECIIRWWNWIQTVNKDAKNTSSSTLSLSRNRGSGQGMSSEKESMGNCPVCRKVFHAKDIEHVLDLVGTHSSQQSLDKTEVKDDESVIHSESENIRRQKFEAILKLQEENSGLIGSKSKKDDIVLPVTNAQNPATLANNANTNETTEQPQNGNTNETTEQPQSDRGANAETNSSSSSTRPRTSKHWNPGMRKHRAPNTRKQQVRQWIRKEDGGAR